MILQQRKPSHIIVIIIANLIPLIGVLGFGWRVSDVVLLYYFETVVLGIFNILKMLFEKDSFILFKFIFIPFFLIHYNFFLLVQGVFVLGIIVLPDLSGSTENILSPENGETLLRYFEQSINPQNLIFYAYLTIVLSYFYYFIVVFWIENQRSEGIGKLLFSPYGRIIVQQVLVIVGGYLVLSFRTPYVFLFLLIVLKTIADLMTRKERQRIQANK